MVQVEGGEEGQARQPYWYSQEETAHVFLEQRRRGGKLGATVHWDFLEHWAPATTGPWPKNKVPHGLSPVNKPWPSAPTRSIIINLQELTAKDMVLKEAWNKEKIHVGNFSHDYKSQTVENSKEYSGIKRALKENRICFQMLWKNMHQCTGSMQRAGRRGVQVKEPPTTAQTEKTSNGHFDFLFS